MRSRSRSQCSIPGIFEAGDHAELEPESVLGSVVKLALESALESRLPQLVGGAWDNERPPPVARSQKSCRPLRTTAWRAAHRSGPRGPGRK